MNLTQKILCYQQGCWTLSDILLHMRTIFRETLGCRRDWTHTEIDELYLSLRPKLLRAIMRFKFQRLAFESYLRKIIFFQARTFKGRETREGDKQKRLVSIFRDSYQVILNSTGFYPDTSASLWPESRGPAVFELSVNPPPTERPQITFHSRYRQPLKHIKSERKSILLLALKHSMFWDDSIICKLAKYTKVSEILLLGMRQELHRLLIPRMERIQSIITCRNSRFLQVKGYEGCDGRRLSLVERMRRTQKNLFASNLFSTHREIAKVTGIPKGTVDSNLFSLQRRHRERGGFGFRELSRFSLE